MIITNSVFLSVRAIILCSIFLAVSTANANVQNSISRIIDGSIQATRQAIINGDSDYNNYRYRRAIKNYYQAEEGHRIFFDSCRLLRRNFSDRHNGVTYQQVFNAKCKPNFILMTKYYLHYMRYFSHSYSKIGDYNRSRIANTKRQRVITRLTNHYASVLVSTRSNKFSTLIAKLDKVRQQYKKVRKFGRLLNSFSH